ncbi:MAG: rRNA maturation RNase YbeY [Candidatus Omnitrophica bacterium]|nr:rRNA maturation RNase YbeY [Candidatus Omnitrophota bacterium]
MKIIIKNLQKKIQIRPKEVRSTVLKVLSSEKKKADIAEITVCFVTDRIIKSLNSRFLGIGLPTDVISFSMNDQSDSKRVVADIAISVDTVKRNALTFGVSLRRESERILIHGLLHLAGYDDRKAGQIKRMRQKEDQYLKIRR